MDADKIDPSKSRYARYILDQLKVKGQGQVVNRQEIITPLEPEIEFMVPDKFRLEPVWVSVVLTALVHAGDVVLAIPGAKFDATNLNALTSTPLQDLQNFKHVERPKDWDIGSLKALFELMDLAPGMAIQVTQGDSVPVQQLHKVINERVERLVWAKQQLLGGIPFWGQNLFSGEEMEKLSTLMTDAKEFLESLQAYNTPGKLKNFKYDAGQIKGYETSFHRLKEVEDLQKYCAELVQFTQYLSAAAAMLPEDHHWVSESKSKRTELLAEIRKPSQRESATFKAELLAQLKKLKAEYIKIYLELYRKARLSLAQDKGKKVLLQDYRLKQLRRLATVASINSVQLTQFDSQLDKIKTGTAVTEKDLENKPRSPDGFWPSMEDTSISAETRLKNLKVELDRIHKGWTKSLLNDLNDPVIQSNFDLLKAAQKKMLKSFMADKELPDDINQEFLVAIQSALSGLSKLPIKLDDLKKVLFPDGSPATPKEFKERFADYIDKILKGRDAEKVRLVIE